MPGDGAFESALCLSAKTVQSNELHRARTLLTLCQLMTEACLAFYFYIHRGTVFLFVPLLSFYVWLFIFPSSGDVAQQPNCKTETLCMTIIYALIRSALLSWWFTQNTNGVHPSFVHDLGTNSSSHSQHLCPDTKLLLVYWTKFKWL